MALEIVQLLLELETRHAVNFRDEEVRKIVTFGELLDRLKQKINEPFDPESNDVEVVLNTLLVELRRRFPDKRPIDRETQFRSILPFWTGASIWTDLQERFSELPDWEAINRRRIFFVDWRIFVGFVVVVLICIAVFSRDAHAFSGWAVAGQFLFCLLLGLAWMFLIVGRFPYRTVRELVDEMVRRRTTRIRARTVSESELESELRTFMVEKFRLEPERIRREARLKEDLDLE